MCVSASISSTTLCLPSKTARLLPADYEPDRCTVVVAKGHLAQQAKGNSALRQLVRSYGKIYSAAGNKRCKTKIVDDILNQVKNWNYNRIGFVKYHEGRWYESSDLGARDIVTARFRDSLPRQYKSAGKCKVAKRRNFKARCRAMKASDQAKPPKPPSSSVSVVSTDENEPSNFLQQQPELEPLPLDAPEPAISSSYLRLEEMLQSRETLSVVPPVPKPSSFHGQDEVTPTAVLSSSEGVAQRRRSSRSIATAFRHLVQAEDEMAPLEAVLDGLDFEDEDVIQSWAADMLE